MSEWLFLLQLQISVAVVVVLLLRQAMKKMPKVYSYLLWLLVFARLLVPISIESRFSFMPSQQERDAFVAEMLENPGEDSVAAEVPKNLGEDSTETEVPKNSGDDFIGGQIGSSETKVDLEGGNTADDTLSQMGVPGTEEIAPGVVKPGAEGKLSSVGADEVLLSDAGNLVAGILGKHWIFMAFWVVGATIVLGYNGMALRKVRQRLQNARYLVDNIQIGAGNAPVYASENINTPFSLGFLKPVIYLPAGLSDNEQEYILCHERVHISRKDNMVKHVAFLLTAIYWFNPFVWLAFFLMERDMEMSCDEKVLKLMGKDIKRNYSQSLLDFAARPKKMPATHLTFGENSVKQRVKNVLSYKNAKKWTIGIGAVVLMVVVVALFTTGRDDSEQVDSRGDQVMADGRDDQVMADGQGSLASGEGNSGENQPGDGTDNSGGESSSDGSTGGNFYGDVQDPIYVSKTPQLALDGWCNRFAEQSGKNIYSDYDYDDNTDEVVIRHFVTDGWNRYVIDEAVRVVVTDSGDLYYVEQESLTDYSTIETNDQFEALYGTPGLRNLNLLRYGADYYRSILQQFHTGGADAEYCVNFLDPVTAAVEMLNLGEGSGVAKLKDGTFVSDGGTLGGVVLDSVQNGLNLQDAYFQEGTYAYVTYTFAKDGSQVEIPMRLIEGSYGLWSVDADAVREIIQEPDDWVNGSIRERLGFTLEFTEYGIYRNADGMITNIFPYYIHSELVWNEEDGILYFPIDAFYKEGYYDYYENMICMLDLTTGEMDLETLSLEGMPVRNGSIMGVNVGFGYVSVTRGNTYSDSTTYYMPLINTGNTSLATGYTYNGKPVKDLTAAEQDAYSVTLRNEILKKGEVVKLSNRTMEETYAYVDLDGDGKAEKIVLSQHTEAMADNQGAIDYPFDCFKLQVGDSIVTGAKEHLENELRFFSPDGKNIVIALYGDGPSDDYTTMMYLYRDGELRKVGEVQSAWTDIVLDQAKGIFYVEDAYHNFMQPVWLLKAWKINESGQVEDVPQDTYEIVYGRTTLPDLLVALPVHETPGGEEVTYIQPQKVDFIRFNSTFDWVYIEAADGTSGWFEIDVQVDSGVTVRIVDLNLNHWEVFTLYYAG